MGWIRQTYSCLYNQTGRQSLRPSSSAAPSVYKQVSRSRRRAVEVHSVRGLPPKDIPALLSTDSLHSNFALQGLNGSVIKQKAYPPFPWVYAESNFRYTPKERCRECIPAARESRSCRDRMNYWRCRPSKCGDASEPRKFRQSNSWTHRSPDRGAQSGSQRNRGRDKLPGHTRYIRRSSST
jgi:hypothetical protein